MELGSVKSSVHTNNEWVLNQGHIGTTETLIVKW